MDSEVYNILETVAADLGLELVQTTTESSGYPRNLWYSLVGFKDEVHFEEAQKALSGAIAEWNKSVVEVDEDDSARKSLSLRGQVLEKRDGHDLWSVDRETFCTLINFFDLQMIKGDDDRVSDIYIAKDADDEDGFVDNLKGVIDGLTSFNDIREAVDRYGKYKQIIDDLEENQMLVVDTVGNYEILPIMASSCHEDVFTYSIALTVLESD